MSVGVLYEHPEWFVPLFQALERRGIPHHAIDAAALEWDPAAAPRFAVLLNRMSPSAYLRGHGHALRGTAAYLDYVTSWDVPVVNGPAAFALEVSKARQVDLLRRLGIPHPRTHVVNDQRQVVRAADGLQFPIVIKPNVGGSGAKIQRFDSRDVLREAAETDRLDFGPDHVALLQEFLPARGGSITRIEVLDGEVLYAIQLTPPAGHGFNLCPADVCRTGEGLCPTKPAMNIEHADVPAEIARQALAISASAGLDVCGIEYLVDERDGEAYFYDINALSNFVTNAPAIVGFDPFDRLVEYLHVRLARVACAY